MCPLYFCPVKGCCQDFPSSDSPRFEPIHNVFVKAHSRDPFGDYIVELDLLWDFEQQVRKKGRVFSVKRTVDLSSKSGGIFIQVRK